MPALILRELLLRAPFSFTFEIFIKNCKGIHKNKIGIFLHCKRPVKQGNISSLKVLVNSECSHIRSLQQVIKPI